MMVARKGPSKKTRFEVFKRDAFTCQYCGRQAPDVTLVVDHIVPVAADGKDDILNYITACVECNQGKGARKLDDKTVIAKRKAQLNELQAKREQLEMMLRWQRELVRIEDLAVDNLCQIWTELLPGQTLTDYGRSELSKLLQHNSFEDVAEAMRTSVRQYAKYSSSLPANEPANKAFDYISRIIKNKKRLAERPYLRQLYYIRGIMRNRFAYVNEWQAMDILEAAYLRGVSIDELKAMALEQRNWTGWRAAMEARTEGNDGETQNP